jgi:hypothetical protein
MEKVGSGTHTGFLQRTLSLQREAQQPLLDIRYNMENHQVQLTKLKKQSADHIL